MATTSGTYNFGSTLSEQIIVDAYERVGILPDIITAQQINSAQRSANFLLSEWPNKGLNMWTIKQSMLGLIPNQNTYFLPANTSSILTADIRTSTRQLGGTAFSTPGGIAQNAFDNNPATACTQTGPNGYISYNYGNPNQQSIAMVGIQSNATLNYTIAFESSNDNMVWTLLSPIPIQSYPLGQLIWFVVPVPTAAQYYRIRETGGATLDIQELYFNTTVRDIPMTPISEQEYTSLPTKNQTGRPSSYWFDRQIQPIIRLWQTPTALYNNMYYTRVCMMQDIGELTNTPDIPQRFYEALAAGLAVKLAVKYAPDRLQHLALLYKESFDDAAKQDTPRVPLRVFGDAMQGWWQQ